MKSVWKIAAVGLAVAVACSGPALAAPAADPETALTRYCEPLISGTSAAQISQIARTDGFKEEQVGSFPALVQGDVIVMLSDTPRVCAVQASPSMTFGEGIALVDRWASRHPDAAKSPAEKGPDGARVKAWSSAKAKQYLLVTEQAHPRGHKVLNFILAPLPLGQ